MMKKPSYEQLLLFQALMETRNLGQAAEKLDMPMSTASAQLAALRAYFGDPLFNRVRNGFAVTEGGKEAFERCITILSAYELIESKRHRDFWQEARTVRIECADNAPFALFPNLIETTLEKAPNITYKFLPLSPNRFERLRNNGIDFAVSPMVRGLPSGFRSLQLSENRYSLVAGLEHPLVKLAKSCPKGVSDEEVIKYAFIDVLLGGDSGNMLLREALFPDWSKARSAAHVSYFLPFLWNLSNNLLLMIMPTRTAHMFERLKLLRVIPTRTKSVVNYPKLFWHESTDKDPLLQWIRAIIKSSCIEDPEA